MDDVATIPMTAPEAAPVRGFPGLTCYHCGQTDCISIDTLENLSCDTAFRCRECESEWGPADVREVLEGWAAVLAWLDAAPTVEG